MRAIAHPSVSALPHDRPERRGPRNPSKGGGYHALHHQEKQEDGERLMLQGKALRDSRWAHHVNEF